MATLNKFDSFVEEVLSGTHDFSAPDTIKAALTNTAPQANDAVLADISQIAATGGYTAGAGGGYALDGVTLSQASGTAKVVITDEVITASGNTVGPFRYIVVYNDTPSSPADPLIGWYDYGSNLTLNDSDSLTLNFDGTNGVFDLT